MQSDEMRWKRAFHGVDDKVEFMIVCLREGQRHTDKNKLWHNRGPTD